VKKREERKEREWERKGKREEVAYFCCGKQIRLLIFNRTHFKKNNSHK
jgi:hypothetical protein